MKLFSRIIRERLDDVSTVDKFDELTFNIEYTFSFFFFGKLGNETGKLNFTLCFTL